MKNISSNKQKILLLLLAGIGLALARSPTRQYRILKELRREWLVIDEKKLAEDIYSLYRSKLVKRIENADGSLTFELTELLQLGFHEIQKSVCVFPYECGDEVEFVIEFFGMRPYARYGTIARIDNDFHLRKIFHLPLES